jgi:glyoxylase I family protein
MVAVAELAAADSLIAAELALLAFAETVGGLFAGCRLGVPDVGIDRRTVIIGAATFAALRTAESAPPDTVEAQVNSPMERVVGIGGLFFRSRNPKTLAQWYQVHLGIDSQPSWQQAAGPTAFNPFPMDTDYFGSRQQAWMVNFRVRNLDAMVAQLRKSNIEVKVDPENYPYGRFARLHDPEGNPIELWEPASPS